MHYYRIMALGAMLATCASYGQNNYIAGEKINKSTHNAYIAQTCDAYKAVVAEQTILAMSCIGRATCAVVLATNLLAPQYTDCVLTVLGLLYNVNKKINPNTKYLFIEKSLDQPTLSPYLRLCADKQGRLQMEQAIFVNTDKT